MQGGGVPKVYESLYKLWRVIAIGMLGRALVVVCPESLSAPREENERIKAREHSPLVGSTHGLSCFTCGFVMHGPRPSGDRGRAGATLSVRHDDLLLGLI